MTASLRITKRGVDHVELEVDGEAAADLVADEAHKKDIKPVIGQRQGLENTARHYVVLHGVAKDIIDFLEQNPKFKVVSG